MFEGTVAKQLLNSPPEGAGVLTRVAADVSYEKIDTITSAWAIQIKHRIDGQAYGVVDLGGFPPELARARAKEYLRDFGLEARGIARRPVWATNGGVTPELGAIFQEVEAELAAEGTPVVFIARMFADTP